MSFITSFRNSFKTQSVEEKAKTAELKAELQEALKSASTTDLLIQISKNCIPENMPQYLVTGGALAAGVTGTIVMSSATPVVSAVVTAMSINAYLNDEGEGAEMTRRLGRRIKALRGKKNVEFIGPVKQD